ncbi:MAG: hypothetical protein FJZ01_23545 [Candidatus Sericytochromatia bacterium]|nr:hypothetical protein [Candidatus Tanganyikabacteria bacterium]
MKTRETGKGSNQKKPAGRGAGRNPAQPVADGDKGDRAARPGKSDCASGAEGPKPTDEIDRLATMKIGELQALLAELTGEKTRCPNRAWLIKKVLEAAVPSVPADTPAETAVSAAGTAVPEPVAGDAAPEPAVEPEGGPATEEATHVPAVEVASPTGLPGADPTATATDTAGAGSTALPKLSKLDVPALRALYQEVVGRETGSTNAAYLQWKIRQASRGAVPTGPRKGGRAEGTIFKVLPLRMESGLVDRLDEAWQRLGLRSRMDLFRAALRTYFASVGEADVARQFDAAD